MAKQMNLDGVKKIQEIHYGIRIPAEHQPRCPACGGFCTLTKMMGDLFWICLHASDSMECDAPEIPASLELTPEIGPLAAT